MASRDSDERTVITGAAQGRSADASRRQRNYLIMMGIRMLCFVGLIFVPGNLKWVLLGGAVVLPYIAVLVVNQGDQRTHTTRTPAVAPQEPPLVSDAPAVTAAPEVIEGEVVIDDHPLPALEGRRPGSER
ncbi:DUF3099 domain-containing protein [Auraticoccus monumenti]|uniref:DUF3099 domain-containing protein n=1 Tax=Auraticoccus monumenti TaxID=675864 RepID=A0A1G7DF42_9ACTN|nr:DUF3099 domain-containing protein [Auraticoccus monumenti]SDE49626.1 Protein of unknown function [Auraticoccus monumenti]